MTEREMEDLLWTYPKHLLGEELVPFRRQQSSNIGRCDVIFKDRLERLLIIELKRGTLGRDAISQLHDYFGMVKQEFPDTPIELMVVANEIPSQRRLACERQHIEVREISEKKFREVADQVGYVFASETRAAEPARLDLAQANHRPKPDSSARWSFSQPDKSKAGDGAEFLSRCGTDARAFFSKLFEKQKSLASRTKLTWNHESGFSMQFYFQRLGFVPMLWGFPKYNQQGKISNRGESVVLPFDFAHKAGVSGEFLDAFGQSLSEVIALSSSASRPGFNVSRLSEAETERIIEVIANHIELAGSYRPG